MICEDPRVTIREIVGALRSGHNAMEKMLHDLKEALRTKRPHENVHTIILPLRGQFKNSDVQLCIVQLLVLI